jgi:hypothetical protein
MINKSVYKFYAINNYMQMDYVDDTTPLLFMDFYLDMAIDEDNEAENLADDRRSEYKIECNVEQLTGKKLNFGTIIPTVYHGNKVIENARFEFTSSDEDVIIVDNKGNYIMQDNGNAIISVQVLGNEKTKIDIPIAVEDVSTVTYSIIVSPIVKSIKQGMSVELSAKVVDSFNTDMQEVVTLTASGTDDKNNYTLVDNGNNTWTLTNKLKSTLPLTLTFDNATYGLSETMEVQLKAMF